MNEAQLRNMVAECVEKTLKEFISPVQPATDYEGNDLNYEHLFDEALKVIDEMNDGVTEIRWQDVAQRMGYHLDTLNEDDMELLHDAIEDAMAVPGIEEEPIQVNETKIAKIVAESVKKVLKEIEDGSDIKQEVEEYVHAMGSQIEQWSCDYVFVDKHGCNGFIYNNEEEAKQSVLNGEEHQNAMDYVKDAQSPEDWIGYLVEGGIDENQAINMVRNGDWNGIVNVIVDKEGPEWFLSQYSGQVHELTNGQLLYF